MNISSIEFEIFFCTYIMMEIQQKGRKIIQKVKSFHKKYQNLRKVYHDILQK